jgi:hypothetical protein
VIQTLDQFATISEHVTGLGNNRFAGRNSLSVSRFGFRKLAQAVPEEAEVVIATCEFLAVLKHLGKVLH